MNFDYRNTAYKYKTGGIPWRGKIGIDISDCTTMSEAIQKAKLNYIVAKCPIAAQMEALPNGVNRDGSLIPNIVNGYEFVTIPTEFATYRTDTNIPLGKVKSRYEVVQNEVAFNFFNDAIGKDVQLDRAGYFGCGQKIFLLAKINQEMQIGNIKDSIDHYFVFTNSHDGGSAVQMMITPIRVACMNALHSARLSANMYLSFRHNQGVNAKILTVPEILGIAGKRVEEEKEMYAVMFNTKVSDADVKKYLSMTFLTGEEFEIVDENNLYEPLFKKDFVTFEQVGLSKQKLGILCDINEYYHSGIAQSQIAGTAYGAYNAITGYFSNVKQYKNEEIRLKNTVFEGDFNTGVKALNYALDAVWNY